MLKIKQLGKKSFYILQMFFLMNVLCMPIAVFAINVHGYVPHGFYGSISGLGANISANNLKGNTGSIANKKVDDRNGFGYAAALGYGLKSYPFRFEVEYTKRPDLHYDPNPVFYNVALLQKMRATISNQTVMFNAYWDTYLSHAPRWSIFVKLGAGETFNRADVKVQDLADSDSYAEKTLTKEIALLAGLGARYKITNHILMSLSYQYVNLNRFKLGPWAVPIAQINAHEYVSNEILLSLTMFLGKQERGEPALLDSGEQTSDNPTLINDDEED